MEKYLNNQLLLIMWKWRKILLIIFAAACIISYVFTGSKFIKPLYKSAAILYPINLSSYSEESETEQMLQILESYDLKRAVIDSLDLYKHYHIDRDAPNAIERIIKKFDQRITVKRTQYESVRIEVLDRFPKHSFNILNEIIEAYNSLALKLVHQKAREVFIIKESLFKQKQHEVDSLRRLVDTLIHQTGLAEYNILKESMRGSFQYIHSQNAPKGTDTILSEKSLDLFFNQKLLENEIAILTELKREFENALSDTQKSLLFADVISEPVIPQKKTWPIRWLILLISIGSTMFVSFATILVIERVQKK
jgi:hypothetical protein